MIELRHMDVRHFVIMDCSHLANGCTIKYGCIGLIIFCYLSCLGAILCDINTIRFVSVFMESLWSFGRKLCNRSLGVDEPKWTSHVKRPSDVARPFVIG